MGTTVFLGEPPSSIAAWIRGNTGPKLDEPLCFTAEDAGATVTFNKTGNPDNANIVVSVNGQNWTPYTFGTTITLTNIGDKVYFRAADENDISFFKGYGNYYRFATSEGKKVAASGNIQTLMKADGSRLDISGKNDCYRSIFQECMSLTTAPRLPATTLANDCYGCMFYNCTSLTTAPELPATTLTDGCYAQMFAGCISLTQAPNLPAAMLANDCYVNIFQNCDKLTSINVNFTAWNPASATFDWVKNVAVSGTFTCPAALPKTTGNDNIPEGWTIIEKY